MKHKKILILSMSGGFGHIKAGQALLEYAKQNLPNVDVEHIDVSDLDHSLKKYTGTLYDTLSKKFPVIWKVLYEHPLFFAVFKKMIGWSGFWRQKMKNDIFRKNPDAIIFTNVVVLPMLLSACRKKFPRIPLGVVVTDYHAHPYYRFAGIDYYFVANEQVLEDLASLEIGREKIVVSGIPVSPKFYVKGDVDGLKLKHGIKSGVPVVLLITSFGAAEAALVSVVGQILEYNPKLHLVVIASGNQEFYQAIKNVFSLAPNLSLITWTDAMDEYMKMADVVVSKAGGLTVSECLTLQKPLIMVNPIPGQEEHNASFVEQNNLGVRVDGIGGLMGVLPGMLNKTKISRLNFAPPPNPSKKIFEHMLKK